MSKFCCSWNWMETYKNKWLNNLF